MICLQNKIFLKGYGQTEKSSVLLEKVLYFANYIVLDKGTSELQYKQVLTEREFQEAREKYGMTFRVGMGAEAVKELLEARMPDYLRILR